MYKIELVENKAKKFRIYKDSLLWNRNQILFEGINIDDINCFDYIMVASYVDSVLSTIAMLKDDNKNIIVYIISSSEYNDDKVMIKQLEFILKLIKKEFGSKNIYVKFLNSNKLILQDLIDKNFKIIEENKDVVMCKKIRD